jgi:DNA polymerase IV
MPLKEGKKEGIIDQPHALLTVRTWIGRRCKGCRLAEKLWSASRKESRTARRVVLKMKTSDFKVQTRSHTPVSPPSSCTELTDLALRLRERLALGPQQRFRLVGLGLSKFRDPEQGPTQPALFE